MADPLTPVSIANADHYEWGAECDGWHLLRAPGLSVIQEHMPAGATEPRHRHANSRQFFFVLAGRLEVEVEGDVHTLGVQTGLEVAPGARHEVRCTGADGADFLVISQPPSHGDRLVDESLDSRTP